MPDKSSDKSSGKPPGKSPDKPPVKKKGIFTRARDFIVKCFLWSLFFFTLIMLVVIFSPISNIMAGPLVVASELKKADMIGVLGGGAYENKILSGLSNERFIHGLRLYKAGLSKRIAFLGGSITNQALKITTAVTKNDGTESINVVEASIMRDIALEFGIKESAVFVDAKSSSTYGNIKAFEKLLNDKGLKSCLVVTGPLHSYRAMRVAGKLKLDCSPAITGDYTPFITSATGRFSLMRRVLWEYAAIALYSAYGYI